MKVKVQLLTACTLTTHVLCHPTQKASRLQLTLIPYLTVLLTFLVTMLKDWQMLEENQDHAPFLFLNSFGVNSRIVFKQGTFLQPHSCLL
jgi:hypothetical protein